MKEIEIEKCMGLSYPIPATNEGMERVLANPVNPPTIQRPPMAYAG